MVVRNYKVNINEENIELVKELEYINYSETKNTKQSRLQDKKIKSQNLFYRKISK